MDRYELVVIGAGPAGLSGAIAAASAGMKTIVFDENAAPGGQLLKQIHKFFGSRQHQAGIRGMEIGQNLLKQAAAAGVQVVLNSPVLGIYPDRDISVHCGEQVYTCKADQILIAAGASENGLAFPGWTLPGVMGAGAAQTLANLHGVAPGKRVLIVGSGNVGLVVGLQLLQAGCTLAGIVDAAPRIGGYGVHAAKLARTGVPFYLGHTVLQAAGEQHVEQVVLARVDEDWQAIPGTETSIEADTVCLAVGLSPMYQLAKQAGCQLAEDPRKGGVYPVTDAWCQTSVPGIFAAGDVAGIEEASSAMITGSIAGTAAAYRAGYLDESAHQQTQAAYQQALHQLRQGMFAGANKGRTDLLCCQEGLPLSPTLLQKGYLRQEELTGFPGYSAAPGFHPVAECTQNIPCNPCEDVCAKGCIRIGDNITALPQVDGTKDCTACMRCVSVCPGQAIFLVNRQYRPGKAAVALPYEFLPLPQEGDEGYALDRSGHKLCPARVTGVRQAKAFDHTPVLIIEIPQEMADQARFFAAKEAAQ